MAVPQESWTYFRRTAGGATTTPVATDTMYRNADGTGAQATTYAYAWYAGTAQPQTVTVTRPTVAAAQNGPGTATSTATAYDANGRATWSKDAVGFLSDRPNRTRSAAGTISRTFRDGQGRAVSEWVGTNDTPASGYWSPANPAGMTKVRASEATDPRGLRSRTTYDARGRTLKAVENYVDGVPSNLDDKTTEYAYGPAGMTTLTARLAGGGGQTTQWVYGVTVAGGSGLDSNDAKSATRWPDPATGSASAAQQVTMTVNELGQPLTSTDRNGTTHAVSYDVLGRVTDDAVTLLGVNVDGAVRRAHTDYDGQGNA